MAISNTLRNELAKKVKLGSETTYFERNDPNSKTINDPKNELEKALNSKEYLEILQAIYDVSPDKKVNGKPYAISKEGSKFKITDITKGITGEITIKHTPKALEISDKVSNKKTIIELQGALDEKKSVTKSFKEQVADILKNNRTDKDIITALENAIKSTKTK